jgi:hypothetical protein
VDIHNSLSQTSPSQNNHLSYVGLPPPTFIMFGFGAETIRDVCGFDYKVFIIQLETIL